MIWLWERSYDCGYAAGKWFCIHVLRVDPRAFDG